MFGLEYHITAYLKPKKQLVENLHIALIPKYEADKQYFKCNGYLYHRARRENLEYSEIYEDFEGDPPEDVMKYINRVDNLYEITGSIKALFRKIENNYSENLATKLLFFIPELPKKDYFTVPDFIEIIKDLHQNNPEQIALIQKCNVDILLLRG